MAMTLQEEELKKGPWEVCDPGHAGRNKPQVEGMRRNEGFA